MKKYCLIIIGMLFAQISFAQQIPTISSANKNKTPIILDKLKISVFVVDNIAQTTMEMDFYNGNSRVMEGELNFPLSNGVTISRFALDVNGKMREGVVVDKEKATQTFEAITRTNVDPGIAEITKGNNFRARVYPIPAKGYKKAIIGFEQEINGDAENYIYKLPLNIKNKLKEFSVKVEVVMNKPKILKSKGSTINLVFNKAQNMYVSEYSQKNKALETYLSFAIPKSKNIKEVITYKGSVTSDNYFYANLNIKPETKKKEKPKSIVVIWDVSSSAKNRNLKKEIKALEGYLNWMESGKVKLITFSNVVHKTKTYENTKEGRENIISALNKISYDGGTNFYSINYSKIKADEILLFSDGISNFGKKIKLKIKTPILVINTASIANHSLLETVANKSKGAYINAFDKTVEQIVEISTYQQKQFIKAEFNSKKIKDVFPKKGKKITDHFSISGKAEGGKTEIVLHFGFGNKITESKTINIDNSKRLNNSLGERIWAQKKLKVLLGKDDRDKIKAHGKKYGLVTPDTSLIVLDNISDYVRYEIVPPAHMKDEYFRIIGMRNQKNTDNREARVSKLCEKIDVDYKWWKKDFKEKKKSKILKDGKIGGATLHREVVAREELAFVTEKRKANMKVGIQGLSVVTEQNSSQAGDKSYSSAKVSIKKDTKKLHPTIIIKKWDSNESYVNKLKSTDEDRIYTKYLDMKEKNKENPSFYFDVATYMFQKGLRKEGLRVISNLAEIELSNTELLRTLGRKLFEFKFYDEAIVVFKNVLDGRSFEPHSYIDLGLTYAEKGDYQKAIESLYTVIDKPWDNDILSRFQGIELVTLHDINSIIAKNKKQVNTRFIKSCLVKKMPVDIRVVIDWDANDTDIDLWVTDPNEEKCSYENEETRIGGKISNDITRGYGPEEFRLKNAKKGKYKFEAKFYSSNKQSILGKVSVRALVYTNFGKKDQHKEVLTIQLDPKKGGDYLIGEIEFEK